LWEKEGHVGQKWDRAEIDLASDKPFQVSLSSGISSFGAKTILFSILRVIGVRPGVSKGVEDGRRPPTLQAGYP
jgi:hypothetical protein